MLVAAWSTSQSRRSSCTCSESWAWSLLDETRRKEMAKQLWESSSNRWSRSWSWCSQSRLRSSCHQSESQQCWNPLAWEVHSGRYILPSPSPLHPHPTDKQLNSFLSKLYLHPWQWESRSRTQMGGTSTHATGCPHFQPRPVAECLPLGPAQKQVWFDLIDDLGNAPSLPTDLATFLGEDITDEQINLPVPCALDANSPRPPYNDANQCHFTPVGGAQPKIGTAPSAKQMAVIQAKPRHRRTPGLVECPDDSIQTQMIWDQWHPSWWQELKAVYREYMGKLGNALPLQCAWQQATAFWLPTAQEEALGWWEAPCSIHGLGHLAFLLHTDFPSTRDFWATRQKETLALAQALQCCAERSEMPPESCAM